MLNDTPIQRRIESNITNGFGYKTYSEILFSHRKEVGDAPLELQRHLGLLEALKLRTIDGWRYVYAMNDIIYSKSGPEDVDAFLNRYDSRHPPMVIMVV